MSERNILTTDHKKRAERLKRRLGNMSAPSHTSSREPSGSSRFVGTGQCVLRLCDGAYDAVSRGLDQSSSSPEIGDKLDKHFPSILSNWKKQQTVHPCIHAELRAILHLSSPPLTPLSAQSGLANEAVSAVSYGLSHTMVFSGRSG